MEDDSASLLTSPIVERGSGDVLSDPVSTEGAEGDSQAAMEVDSTDSTPEEDDASGKEKPSAVDAMPTGLKADSSDDVSKDTADTSAESTIKDDPVKEEDKMEVEDDAPVAVEEVVPPPVSQTHHDSRHTLVGDGVCASVVCDSCSGVCVGWGPRRRRS